MRGPGIVIAIVTVRVVGCYTKVFNLLIGDSIDFEMACRKWWEMVRLTGKENNIFAQLVLTYSLVDKTPSS